MLRLQARLLVTSPHLLQMLSFTQAIALGPHNLRVMGALLALAQMQTLGGCEAEALPLPDWSAWDRTCPSLGYGPVFPSWPPCTSGKPRRGGTWFSWPPVARSPSYPHSPAPSLLGHAASLSFPSSWYHTPSGQGSSPLSMRVRMSGLEMA